MQITIPITLLISLATFAITVSGTWFVTQRRIKDLEAKVSRQDLKYDQIILEINGIKMEIAKVLQGDIAALNEKIELMIQGKLKNG
jgi:cell division protein FtsL